MSQPSAFSCQPSALGLQRSAVRRPRCVFTFRAGRAWGRWALGLSLATGGLVSVVGCTAESTRVAIETQRRADEVHQAVSNRQQEALRVLLYRDLVNRLAAADRPLSAAQRETLSEIWNDRDLIEFWALQNERVRALRLVGVDAKLVADQSIVDLLWKSIETRLDRAERGLGAQVAAELGQQMPGR